MVRVEYFTTLDKIGLGNEGYFTSVLISRVCLVKTLKTLKLLELNLQIEMIKNEEWGTLIFFLYSNIIILT